MTLDLMPPIPDDPGRRKQPQSRLYDIQRPAPGTGQYNLMEEIRTAPTTTGWGNEVVTSDPEGSRTVGIYNQVEPA